MNLDAFVAERRPTWAELDELVRRARGRPERLGPAGIRRLGLLYRGAVADLARTRRSAPGDPVVRALEELVNRARATIYAGVSERHGSSLRYLGGGYWREIRALWRPVALAWLLTVGSVGLALAWALHDPGAAAGLVPGSLAGGGSGPDQAIGLGAGQAAALSVSIFTHNIGVSVAAFASGILLGIGPALFLLYNGVVLGAVVGIASSTGHTAEVIELIVPHGLLEISCIVVCGAAGMRMGWAIVEPGYRARRDALSEEARRAVLLVVTTALFLVVAGLIEGFITPHRLPLAAALAVGLGAAAPYWAAVAWLGHRRPTHEASP